MPLTLQKKGESHAFPKKNIASIFLKFVNCKFQFLIEFSYFTVTFTFWIIKCSTPWQFCCRDAEACKSPVDTRIRPEHEPTFTSNVQGLLRTKVEGGECYGIISS